VSSILTTSTKLRSALLRSTELRLASQLLRSK
jgi:hypothetical protein